MSDRRVQPIDQCHTLCAGGHTCGLSIMHRHTWHVCANPGCICHSQEAGRRQLRTVRNPQPQPRPQEGRRS